MLLLEESLALDREEGRWSTSAHWLVVLAAAAGATGSTGGGARLWGPPPRCGRL